MEIREQSGNRPVLMPADPTLPATTGVRLLISSVEPNYPKEVSPIRILWLGATSLLASFQIATPKKYNK